MTTHATPTAPRLDLKVPSGKIDIEFAEQDTTSVELSVISGGNTAQEAIDATVEELRTGGDGTPEVIVHVPEQKGRLRSYGRQPEILLRVIAPVGADVRVTSTTADVRAGSGAQAFTVKTIAGDVELGDVTGDVRVDTTSGDIRVGDVGGSTRAKSMSGDLVAGALGGEARLRTMSGDVKIARADSSANASTMSGDVTVSALLSGEVELSSMSGDIEAGIVRGVRVFLDLKTISGDARSNLDPADGPSDNGHQLNLKATSKSGDVTVNRAAVPAHA
jgi:hypothetical protein